MRVIRKKIRDMLGFRNDNGPPKGIIDLFRAYRRIRYGQLRNVSEILISKKSKIVFATNPKCASRSIINWFVDRYPDAQILEYRSIISLWRKYGDSYRFYTVVRPPVDRVISCFNEKVGYENEYRFRLVFGQAPGITVDASLEDFVSWLSSNRLAKDGDADRHLASQQWLLRPDKVAYHRVFTLDGLWTQMQNENLAEENTEALKTLNVSSKKVRKSDITPGIQEKINQRYAGDIAWMNAVRETNRVRKAQ